MTRKATVEALACAMLVMAACERAPSTEREAAQGAPDAPAATAIDSTPQSPGIDDTAGRPDQGVERTLRAALDARVAGTAARIDSVDVSWFSAATADVIRSVRVDADGHAVVDMKDLRSIIPNASSSAGSEALLRELNATVFGVEGVRSVEYRMAGSCELLGEWLQYGVCLSFDRADRTVAGSPR